jgi:hypothetical protein
LRYQQRLAKSKRVNAVASAVPTDLEIFSP